MNNYIKTAECNAIAVLWSRYIGLKNPAIYTA